jgi:cell division protein ZapA
MPRQSVPVHVFNQTYTLLADDDPREVQEIAHQIDELMVSIASRGSSGDSTRVAVLACFHLADKLRAAERKLHLFEAKSEHIGTLLEEALEQA